MTMIRLSGRVGALICSIGIVAATCFFALTTAGDSRMATLDISSSLRKGNDAEADVESGVVVKDWTENDSEPRTVCWLMSFPNSGTSYTIRNTELISGRSTATNYATEIRPTDIAPIALHREDNETISNGPWKRTFELPLPPKNVLCKTHCSGYNDYSSAEESVETYDSFLDGCRESHQRKDLSNPSSRRNKLRANYEVDGLVDSAIHLVRDPFDNILSRMHLGWSHHHSDEHGLSPEELDTFMQSKEALKVWCNGVDQHFFDTLEVKPGMDIPNETLAKLPYDPTPYLDVPCHGEFFRYVQWHNFAVEIIERRNLPVLTVYYEDYAESFNQTVDEMLDFLGLTWEHDPKPFHAGKTYRDFFFENSMQHSVKHLIKDIASEKTWLVLRRYFTSSD